MLQLYSFDSSYSLVVLGEGGGGIREDQISSGYQFQSGSVSEPPICIFITHELVTRMTPEAYV